MAQAIFISEGFLKQFTPISASLDVKMIFPHVQQFQDAYIQDLLGSSLYERLQDGVANDNLNADETVLINLCRTALAWGVLAKMLPFIWTQVRNVGLQQSTAENGSSADLNAMKYVRNEAQTSYEFYSKRIQDYLCFNGNKFPEYVSPDATKMIPSGNSTYDSDLWLDGSYGEFDLKAFWRHYVR